MKTKTEHIALFVDLENFVGYCNSLGLPLDLGPEIEKLTETGKVTIRRSFGDIHKMPMPYEQKYELRKMLQRNLILHEDIPHWNNFKNSSDIRLVIEALSLVFTNDDIDLVAVVANDRDYLPLFSKLREIGKEVIGIGGSRDNTPEIYLNACDLFLYHETLCGKSPSADLPPLLEPAATQAVSVKSVAVPANVASVEASPPAQSANATGNPTDEATRLLLDALKIMESKGHDEPSGAAVIQVMKRLKADFDFETYGYKSFKSLCERAASMGTISILHNGTSFKLRLCHAAEAPEDLSSDAAIANPEKPAHMELLEWVENKMKTPLLDHAERLTLYKHILNYFTKESNVSLSDLSRTLSMEIVHDDSKQQAYYKIIYSLYRADCFCCSQGKTTYNPIIINPNIPLGSESTLDRMFIENSLRLYTREKKAPVDHEGWSKVFFKSDANVEIIKEIAQLL